MKKIIFLSIAWISILLGIIGIFLPILPTTPFLILAGFFFSKSSQKLHKKLLNHPFLGKYVRDWEEFGVIKLKAKITATLLIILTFSYSLYLIRQKMNIQLILIFIAMSVLTFIWSRPSHPAQTKK